MKLMAVWRQAWGMLEAQEGNLELARQMLKCSVKADPSSQQSWQVGFSHFEFGHRTILKMLKLAPDPCLVL